MDFYLLLAIPLLVVVLLGVVIARRGGRMRGYDHDRVHLDASHHALDRSDDTLRNDSWGY